MEDEELIAAKRRQALRRNEPELRSFEQKLRDALLLKEQICQIKEKRHRDLLKQVHSREESKALSRILAQSDEIQNLEMQQTHKTQLRYGQTLQLQMDLKRRSEARNGNEILEEKIRLAELEVQLTDEKLREDKSKKSLASLLIREMDLFKKSKEAEAHQNKLISLEEERKAKEYEELQNRRKSKLLEDLKKKMKGKEAICDMIAANMLAQQRLIDERMRLIKDLQEHEYMVKQKAESEEAQSNKIISFRNELVNILKMQINMHMEREKNLREDEVKYRKQLLDKASQEEKELIEKEFISKLKNEKYRYDVQNQIRGNKQKFIQNEELIKNANAYVRKYNDQMKKNIDREKLIIAQEYSSK
ncbi:uncharacterized protein LOC143918250 [Arctopsyche grandis]|uniref:uncharacterized protein LOC143918250 n=1 Tax=Arctopsyche grandis TaxID=121162 RepID=UPI00406D949B